MKIRLIAPGGGVFHETERAGPLPAAILWRPWGNGDCAELLFVGRGTVEGEPVLSADYDLMYYERLEEPVKNG